MYVSLSLFQHFLSRRLMCLQVQSDVRSGRLPCSSVTQAILGAFMVQATLGDYGSGTDDVMSGLD